jgi:hypothetical protein
MTILLQVGSLYVVRFAIVHHGLVATTQRLIGIVSPCANNGLWCTDRCVQVRKGLLLVLCFVFTSFSAYVFHTFYK